jgi:lysylphosphatidylglycerol synthetase-like protein (DUF2156 family)
MEAIVKPLDTLRPEGQDRTLSALERYADNPSAFLALNSGNEYFTTDDIDGFVCYRPYGHRWIQFGGPFAAPANRVALQTKFIEQAHSGGRRIIGVQLQQPDAELFAELGLTVNQVGASYVVDLKNFSLRGKHYVRLRNKISRALRMGLEISEVDATKVTEQIEDINRRWLREKGRHVKELDFLIGEIGGPWQHLRKLFMGSIDGQPVGYISYAPVYGSRTGWLHDLSRRLPDCPPGVMEAINSHAIEQVRALDAPWLHFGFTPFLGLNSEYDMPTASRATARITRFLGEHGDKVYPAKSQVAYKMKWSPSVILPEYFAFDGGISLRSLWSLLRVTNIV